MQTGGPILYSFFFLFLFFLLSLTLSFSLSFYNTHKTHPHGRERLTSFVSLLEWKKNRGSMLIFWNKRGGNREISRSWVLFFLPLTSCTKKSKNSVSKSFCSIEKERQERFSSTTTNRSIQRNKLIISFVGFILLTNHYYVMLLF
jgi:hypothetical protein